MSLVQRQINKKISDKTLEFLKSGVVPENMKIFSSLRDFLTHGIGLPTMKYRPQLANSVIDIVSFNLTLDEIGFDIRVLYEEIISQFQGILSQFHLSNTVYNTSSRELDRLISHLNEILFTIKNADDHFYGFIENFDTLDRADQALTTPGLVDLQDGTLILPSMNAGTSRVVASHLFAATDWPVSILSNHTIESNSAMQGAGFGNAFVDLISAWRHRIITKNAGKLQAQFQFPIAGKEEDEAEILINRISLTPHADFPFRVRLTKSTDNINYTVFPGYSEFITLNKQSKVYNLDFPTELVQFIRIEVEKDIPDRQINETTWEYLFGFYNISLFTIGRVSDAIYVSKPFETKKPIGKVSISSTSSMPKGTEINYYVGLVDSDNDLLDIWHPITPVNTNRDDFAAPRVVKFGDSETRIEEFLAPSTGYIYDTYKASNLYLVNTSGTISNEPLFGSSQLFRGDGVWSRDENTSKDTFFNRDVFVDFSASDSQSLYVVETETVIPQSVTGAINFVVNLTYQPYYVPTLSHTLVPATNVNPNFDQAPNYAIYEVKWLRKSDRKSQFFTSIAGNTIRLSLNTSIDTDRRPEVFVTKLVVSGTTTNMNRLLREDIDYTVVNDTIVAIDEDSSWWKQQLKVNGLLDFSVFFYEEDDLTQKVSSINGSVVTINSPYTFLSAGDSISIRYRRVAKSPSIDILSDTIVVKSLYGREGRERAFIYGTDYTVDVLRGSIYRIPNGSIPSTASIYVDFSYEKAVFPTETFSAWVLVSRPDFPDISISSLTLNKAAGESFILNSPKGLVDLSNINKIPSLNVGWHQFIVKSVDPDDTLAAIRQILSLRDNYGRIVFAQKGEYFERIVSTRIPLKQVTYDFLKKGILPSNHDFFAIKNGKIVLNFDPSSSDDVYPYMYSTSQNALVKVREKFTLEYYIQTVIAPSNKISVKIELSRRSSIDGGITPRVDNYSLRISP